MNKMIMITINFFKDPGSIIGKAEINEENVLAESVLRDIDDFYFEPGYIKHKDGTVELLELSAVRKSKDHKRSEDD